MALPFTRRSFAKDAYIVREGQETTECTLLLKGFAFRQKFVRDGGRQIISVHIPSEFIDLQNGVLGVADHNVQSVNRCEMAIVPRSALTELMAERPGWPCGSIR